MTRSVVAVECTKRNGREVWRITTEGGTKTIITSATSVAAMDEALVIYGAALERLAKR